MELYIKISLELPDGTTVLLVPEQWEQTTFSFVMPAISSANETVSTRLLITAINMHDNISTLNKSLIIDNALPEGYESILFSPDIALTDLSDLALLSSQMQLLLKSPLNILNNDRRICYRDNDWNDHGSWTDSGLACQWDDGYTGVDCSMNYQVFSSLTNVVDKAVDFLSGELITQSYFKRSDLQMHFEILTALLIRPELYKFEQVHNLIGIIEEIANIRDSLLLSFLTEFDQVFLNFVSLYYIKINYEAYVVMNHYNETEIKSEYSSYSDKLSNIKVDTELAWIYIEKYLIRWSSKINSGTPHLKYSTDAGTFQIEYKIASSLNGSSYSIDSEKGYTISFPSDLFDRSSLIDLTNSVRVLIISWGISPIMLSNEDSFKLASDTLSIHLIDSDMNTIQISNKTISLTVPFVYGGFENLTDLSCKAWAIEFYNTALNDAEWEATLTNDDEGSFANWEECETNFTVSITTSHLSSFALVEPTNSSIDEVKYKGVGEKRGRLVHELPLYKTNFMFWLYGIISWYLIGMLLFVRYENNKI